MTDEDGVARKQAGNTPPDEAARCLSLGQASRDHVPAIAHNLNIA
jgi:hypothetical protein